MRLILPRLRELTLRIIIKALFDLDLAEEGTRLSRIFATVVDAQPSGFRLDAAAALLGLPVYARARGAGAVRAAAPTWMPSSTADRATPREGADRGDVLSMLLEARDEDGQPLNDVEIRDQAMTLIAAGHETTFTALSWTLDLLSRWPEAYARLRDEVADGSAEARRAPPILRGFPIWTP